MPNTLDPALNGIDYNALPAMFADCLAPGGANLIREDIMAHSCLQYASPVRSAEPRNAVGMQLENFVGSSDVQDDALRALGLDAVSNSAADKMARIADRLKPFLPLACQNVLQRIASARKTQTAKQLMASSDYVTTDEETQEKETQEEGSPLAGKSQDKELLLSGAKKTPVRKQWTMPEGLLSPYSPTSPRGMSSSTTAVPL